MQCLIGSVGIGYVCYLIVGSFSLVEVQLFYVNLFYGIILVYNGNLINVEQLVKEIYEFDLCYVNINFDLEVLFNVFVYELVVCNKLQFIEEDIFVVVFCVYDCCVGGYVVVVMIIGYGIVGFCDFNVICLIVFGQWYIENGVEYMIVFESVVLDVFGFILICDLVLGEVVYIIEEGKFYICQCVKVLKYVLCIFEYVYLVCLDLIMDGILVYKVCLCMGEKFVDKIFCECFDYDIDVVILILDISCIVVLELVNWFGVKFCEGFVKNCYIGCIFIMFGQVVWKKFVWQKFNVIELEFCGKNVMLVDDFIVCGIICKQIIQMVCEVGVKNVYFCFVVLVVCYFNVYGIDMLSVYELIVYNCSIEDVSKLIGVDWLVYQDLFDLIDVVGGGKIKIDYFDCVVFDGEYVIGDVNEVYLNWIEQVCNDVIKVKSQVVSVIIDLYND